MRNIEINLSLQDIEDIFYGDPSKGGSRGGVTSYYYLWVAISKGYISVQIDAYKRIEEPSWKARNTKYIAGLSGAENQKNMDCLNGGGIIGC